MQLLDSLEARVDQVALMQARRAQARRQIQASEELELVLGSSAATCSPQLRKQNEGARSAPDLMMRPQTPPIPKPVQSEVAGLLRDAVSVASEIPGPMEANLELVEQSVREVKAFMEQVAPPGAPELESKSPAVQENAQLWSLVEEQRQQIQGLVRSIEDMQNELLAVSSEDPLQDFPSPPAGGCPAEDADDVDTAAPDWDTNGAGLCEVRLAPGTDMGIAEPADWQEERARLLAEIEEVRKSAELRNEAAIAASLGALAPAPTPSAFQWSDDL